MTPLGYCVDLSHHQAPASVPWETMRGRVDAVICRAGYGAARDRHVTEHVARAREIGAKLGLYLFFRPSQPVDVQFARLVDVAAAVRLGPGDIVPAIDIERDPVPSPGENVSPAWEPRCRELVDRVAATWGDCLVYITQREWGQLGKPLWVLERPLWVAHYTTASAPATPGGQRPVLWQHRVGPFDPSGPGGTYEPAAALDQSRILAPLPLIAGDAQGDDVLGPELRDRAERLLALGIAKAARHDDDHDTDPAPAPEERNT